MDLIGNPDPVLNYLEALCDYFPEDLLPSDILSKASCLEDSELRALIREVQGKFYFWNLNKLYKMPTLRWKVRWFLWGGRRPAVI